MKLKVHTLLLLLFVGCRLFAETTDSLVRFKDLNFKNEFEKNTFKKYMGAGKNDDVIDLFLTHYTKKEIYGSADVHQQINDCVAQLKKETDGETEPKKVKAIYKYVHKRFFKVYKLNNSFTDIFEKGEYNCVSGSALYAIVFQLMDIPYQIVEAPQHVFLFAYPNSHKIAIETTSPQNGYFTFTDSYVEKFIKYMYEAKLISKEEYESNTVNQLFNKYYFASKGLSIQALAGIQYSNYRAYYAEESDYEKALEEIKKAYYLNPNERNKYLLQLSLSYMVTNKNYSAESDVNNLVMLCRYNNINEKEVSDEKIKYEFGRVTQEQLINNSNYAGYKKSFQFIHGSISDTALKNSVAFHYHYEVARLGYNNSADKEDEMEHLKAAYKINAKHADLQSMIKSYFGKVVEKSNNPVSIMKEIDFFEANFDFLNNDDQFNGIKANCYLELAYQHFVLNEISKGEKYLGSFEKLCSKNKSLKPGERFVEKAYSTAATYYYKKGNSTKTKQLLKTGISHAPDNFGLQIRLNQVQ